MLTVGVTEAVKHEIKKHKGRFLAAFLARLAASVLKPKSFSVVKCITGKVATKARRRYCNNLDKNF